MCKHLFIVLEGGGGSICMNIFLYVHRLFIVVEGGVYVQTFVLSY